MLDSPSASLAIPIPRQPPNRGLELDLVLPDDFKSLITPDYRPKSLERLLARADCSSVAPGFSKLICSLCGVPESASGYPLAALARLGDSLSPDEHYWITADPVHLRADMHRVMLMSGRDAGLDREEAGALIRLFNEFYAEDGWQLEAADSDRWYLRSPHPLEFCAPTLSQMIGKDITGLGPEGPGKKELASLLSEVQMLLYSAPSNQEREDKRQPTINSLWLSGGGSIPAPLSIPYSLVFSDSALAKGVGHWGGAEVEPLPDSVQSLLELNHQGRVLLTLSLESACGNAILSEMESHWFQPLLQAVSAGIIQTLKIYPGNAKDYQFNRAASRRFWRRAVPIHASFESL